MIVRGWLDHDLHLSLIDVLHVLQRPSMYGSSTFRGDACSTVEFIPCPFNLRPATTYRPDSVGTSNDTVNMDFIADGSDLSGYMSFAESLGFRVTAEDMRRAIDGAPSSDLEAVMATLMDMQER